MCRKGTKLILLFFFGSRLNKLKRGYGRNEIEQGSLKYIKPLE